MSEVTLSDGRVITVDLLRITLDEYRTLIKPVTTDAQQAAEDEIVARAAGITADELRRLPQPDWRRVVVELFRAAREPLADPN